MSLKRGDVLFVDLVPRSGSEQTGRRPALLVSDDRFNRIDAWRSLIVIPMSTSSAQARRGPTSITLPAGTGGLKEASVMLCHQITTLDRSKVVEKWGRLPRSYMIQVEAGIKAALDLE